MTETVSETDSARGQGPVIILVEPQLGENIGMVARAMANFGLSELRLVSPRDGWPNEKAVAAASSATWVIDNAKVYPDLRAALADLGFVVATTARERDGFKPVRGPVDSTAMLRARATRGERIGIMFGRERFGLDNEEIGLSDEIVTFPVDRRFASLNIAQAVLLMSYEWMKSGLESPTDIPFSGPDTAPAPKAVLHGYFEHLEAALQARGYFRPPAKKAKMVDKLRAVLTRPGFTVGELKVLRGILASLDYYSPDEPRGTTYPARKAEADEKAHPPEMQRRAGGRKRAADE
jgi:tRNA/rRNA methyltransferase